MSKSVKALVGSIAVAAVILAVMAATRPDANIPSLDVDKPASLTMISELSEVVDVGQPQRIEWISDNYLSGDVQVNIIRKVADNPARYELVRSVSLGTLNDGTAVWVPALTDVGNDIYIEIACVVSGQACAAAKSTKPLAVVDAGIYSNAAAAYEAIEAEENQ